ncbi:hypothetical protein [Pseudomonas thivervalensis]|uniref:hypothetical protein n=1 Tax=Pseudomonas thivervalensis TaxID=86265 RepID=UPI00069D0373|nr:hypothetical protein [Pseudomonas thivervalensis]
MSNKRKAAYLAKKAEENTEGGIADSNVHKLMRFNFYFFNRDQPYASDFTDLDHDELQKLINKFAYFSESSLFKWANETAGKNNVFVNYRRFPKPSEFQHPACVPHDVEWCRFRIGSRLRLIGFIVPNSYHGTMKDDFVFDKNTFYLVFIDKEHKFYKTEPR